MYTWHWLPALLPLLDMTQPNTELSLKNTVKQLQQANSRQKSSYCTTDTPQRFSKDTYLPCSSWNSQICQSQQHFHLNAEGKSFTTSVWTATSRRPDCYTVMVRESGGSAWGSAAAWEGRGTEQHLNLQQGDAGECSSHSSWEKLQWIGEVQQGGKAMNPC